MKTSRQKLLTFITTIFLMIFQLHLYAQEEADIFTAKNSVYVELGGNSLFYSLNYSRILHQHDRLKISGSAGFSFFKQSGGDQISGVSPYWSPLLPVEITAFWGRSCHHLEVGTGVTFYSSRTLEFNPDASSNFQENKSLEAIIPLRIGYRYQQPEGGFFFRVGCTPGFNLSFSSQNPVEFHALWGGISLGKSF